MGYDKSFYERFTAMHVPAARRVMQEFAHLAQPQSAIDIGCGDGSFLSTLPEFGVVDYLGIEGPWIGEEQLQIPASQVLRRDLNQPFRVERRYDLAISIEVAEHLRPERAQTLVDDLTRLADLVLFSVVRPLAFWRARKPPGLGYLLRRQAPAALDYSIRRLGPHRERRLDKPV
jgi:hypothetical protein